MLKFLARILLAIPGWIAYLAPMALLILLGFLIVPIAALPRFMQYRESDRYKGRMTLQFGDWLWMYCNEEDGVDGGANGFWPSVVNVTTRFSGWKQIVAWSAWRNSVGNARWLPFFGLTIANPKAITAIVPDMDEKLYQWRRSPGATFETWWTDYRKTGPYLARYGWRFELRFPWSATHFCWIGWRIAQQDTPNTGVGFAFQPWSKL
jgi:hypothetical protein